MLQKVREHIHMKDVLGKFILVAALLGGLFLVLNRLEPAEEPSDVIDRLVDAGIEFATNPVEAALLEHRKIVIGTDINGYTTQRVARELLLLDARDSNQPIDLYIRTEGGWVDDAFSIISVMESIKSPVNTHAIGGTHSSGAMILAAGTGVRCAYPYSSIMFHGGLYKDDGEYGENTIDNERLVAFWERHARIPSEWLHSNGEKTCFMGAEEALKLGIVDEICASEPDLEEQGAATDK